MVTNTFSSVEAGSSQSGCVCKLMSLLVGQSMVAFLPVFLERTTVICSFFDVFLLLF
jgi:hypothetical protein